MPYSTPITYRTGNRLVIEVELPEHGELSQRGRAENFVDPRPWYWIAGNDDGEGLAVKLTVCKPLRSRRRP